MSTKKEELSDQIPTAEMQQIYYKSNCNQNLKIQDTSFNGLQAQKDVTEEEKQEQNSFLARLKSSNGEPSEIDMDEYLLGSRQNNQDSVIKDQSEDKSAIMIDKLKPDKIKSNLGLLNQHHPMSKNGIFLQPHYNRCNTGERKDLVSTHPFSIRSDQKVEKSKIKKTITGISQCTGCSKFISPVLKMNHKKSTSQKM